MRESGYYWVRDIGEDGHWLIAHWSKGEGPNEEGFWGVVHSDLGYEDIDFSEIGPRVPDREDLQRMRDKLNEYARRFGHLD